MSEGLVIGEVGGSSSRWAWVTPGASPVILPSRGKSLLGFNPLSGDADRFVADLHEGFSTDCPAMLDAGRLLVYAAGCSAAPRKAAMGEALSRLWPAASITVDTDLMGAAVGLCGSKPGLVLILGTGMNAGWYDGTHLFTPMPSLGWALGDEGSGADIGRTLLQDALLGRMPETVREELFGVNGPDLDSTLEAVYRSPFPARTLAAYTSLLAGRAHAPYVRDLLLGRFHGMAEIITEFFTAEQRAEVYATGSVAYGFREVLAGCLLDRGMTLMAVEPDPLPGLVRRHHRPV